MMNILLNGEQRPCLAGQKLQNLLLDAGYRLEFPIAVAVNQVLVHAADYPNYALKDQDQVEVLMPMQGG